MSLVENFEAILLTSACEGPITLLALAKQLKACYDYDPGGGQASSMTRPQANTSRVECSHQPLEEVDMSHLRAVAQRTAAKS